ncbi:MAG: hypothetical protein ACR2JK_17715, partial [Geodermatophilaceae bacterium]
TQLAEQLDRGLVYDRDLADLAQSLEAATEALNRRPWSRARRGRSERSAQPNRRPSACSVASTAVVSRGPTAHPGVLAGKAHHRGMSTAVVTRTGGSTVPPSS